MNAPQRISSSYLHSFRLMDYHRTLAVSSDSPHTDAPPRISRLYRQATQIGKATDSVLCGPHNYNDSWYSKKLRRFIAQKYVDPKALQGRASYSWLSCLRWRFRLMDYDRMSADDEIYGKVSSRGSAGAPQPIVTPVIASRGLISGGKDYRRRLRAPGRTYIGYAPPRVTGQLLGGPE